MTKVIFRKFRDGSVIALFPNIPWDNNGNIASYMHVGQHGGASLLLLLTPSWLRKMNTHRF